MPSSWSPRPRARSRTANGSSSACGYRSSRSSSRSARTRRTRGGPSVLITTLGVFRFADSAAVLVSFAPGSSVDRIRAETGWDLAVARDVRETESPTADVLRVIREYDPDGFWTRRDE